MLIPSVVLTDKLPVSVARSVTVLLPAVVGVPVIVPVPAFKLNPAGKPVAAYDRICPLASVKDPVGNV